MASQTVLDKSQLQGLKKNAIHFFREVQEKKKWLEIEIEKWKWNKNDWKLRSRSESEMKMTRDREVKFNDNLFMKLGVKFHYFSLTFFEKLKWNRNDWKLRSRSESEIKMTWDREVKFKIFLENRDSRRSLDNTYSRIMIVEHFWEIPSDGKRAILKHIHFS